MLASSLKSIDKPAQTRATSHIQLHPQELGIIPQRAAGSVLSFLALRQDEALVASDYEGDVGLKIQSQCVSAGYIPSPFQGKL